MSLSTLISGADCGPVNALQALTKRVDGDRGVQQDHFGSSQAGPSRPNAAFITRSNPNPELQGDAARFFSNQPTSSPHGPITQPPFDLSSLRSALDGPVQNHLHHSRPQRALDPTWQAPPPAPQLDAQTATTGWLSDFLAEQNKSVTPIPVIQNATMHHVQPPTMTPNHLHALPRAHGMGFAPYAAQEQPQINVVPVSRPQISLESWEQEFASQSQALAQSKTVEQPLVDQRPVDGDELARTAGLLVDSVKHEENPKFKNSAFLSFMRQVRDREMVVDGNDIVPASEANVSFGTSQNAHQSAAETLASLSNTGIPQSTAREPMLSSRMAPSSSHLEPQLSQSESLETEEDAYWEQENRDYMSYWRNGINGGSGIASALPMHTSVHPMNALSSQGREWDALQNSWDQWEATTTGVRRTYEYDFQPNNPYVVGESSQQTHHHALHSFREQGVLQYEAAVLRDPDNAQAWFELGIKQQANEREDKAIQALRRAVELNPDFLSAWLELAVSYTNDGNRSRAYDSIVEWMNRNNTYSNAVQSWKSQEGEPTGVASERVKYIIGCLLEMARSGAASGVDPDVQIALGVMLNTTDEYEKARDCFMAALEIRPDDALLYNRVGATMANNGQSEQALWYYLRALDLNPTYIRARFNLGISYISLQQHEEAAKHILDALVLQEEDGLNSGDERGITSSVLWDSLRNVCLHLRRADLAALCISKDLTRFRAEFHRPDY